MARVDAPLTKRRPLEINESEKVALENACDVRSGTLIMFIGVLNVPGILARN